jgi:integrase
MKVLGDGEWIFRSEAGTPIDPVNFRNRHLHRTAMRVLEFSLGGFHDFLHTVSTDLLKHHPTKVVSELLGHDVKTMRETRHHVQAEDFRRADERKGVGADDRAKTAL